MVQAGVIVACDRDQEWLLPWWWRHYSSHSSYPVHFIDFGMSSEGVSWCKERGSYEPLVGFDHFHEHPVEDEQRKIWETEISSIFDFRRTYFKKPFALIQSPFDLTIWLDLDCQLIGPLDPLFTVLHMGVDFSVKPQGKGYSAGVIAFRKDSTTLKAWFEEINRRNELYIHDEQALERFQITWPLPEIYNWNPLHGENLQAVVLHYQGGFLKQELRRIIAKDPSLSYHQSGKMDL